jgi:hypothetical protein
MNRREILGALGGAVAQHSQVSSGGSPPSRLTRRTPVSAESKMAVGAKSDPSGKAGIKIPRA